jgi:methyl-accepting chemotaxis protein
MDMTIKQKLFMPMFGAVILLSVTGFGIIKWQISNLGREYALHMAQNKMREVSGAIDAAAQQALENASFFIRIPGVVSAFETAHTGSINDENDAAGQKAREMLRKEIKPMMDGFSAITGNEKIKLHFHLPNGRSLLRAWLDKQIQRNGQWMDISDDISDFRQTVLDVNQLGKPVRGIELGRGGFVIRGIAPVKSFDGRPLGSAEVLLDLDPLLETAAKSESQDIMLYMNADRLKITHRLQDPKRYPLIDNRYVLVSKTSKDTSTADLSILDRGREDLFLDYQGEVITAAFPVRDYKGEQIGVIVYLMKISRQKYLEDSVFWTLSALLLGILIAAGGLSGSILNRTVIKPIGRLTAFSKQLSEGCLDQSLEIHQKDEIGSLSEALNTVTVNVGQMFTELLSGIETLTASAVKIADSVDEQASVSTQQSASVSEITATMSELLSSSAQIAGNANAVANIASEALDSIKSGVETVEGISRQMNDISGDNRRIIQRVIELGNKSRDISKVMELINTITDQTKLIAFNAALEASGAGNAGKRFGVVAAEIRRLADSVMESTGEIETKISEIQEAVNNMIVDSEKGAKVIEKGLAESVLAAGKLNEIVEGAQSMSDAARQISLSTQQQQTASEQVVMALKEIDGGIKYTSQSINRISTISRDLETLSGNLKGMADKVKV